MPENISTAISPYIARTKKAIDFYEANLSKTSQHGLMMCIAGGLGDSAEWVGGTPVPSLNTTQLIYIRGFKRYKSMSFVIPDTGGSLDVGGISWSSLSIVDDPNWYVKYANILTQNSRWLYIEAELGSGELDTATYKQVGLYSKLKITDSANYEKELLVPSEISRTGSAEPDYVYDGILEVYQNKDSVITRNSELKETFTWVLEF